MRRDPEGRRRTIVAATIRVMAAVGVGQTTHRRIAAEAGVPLGSITYYFPTLDGLVREALAVLGQDFQQDLERWRTALSHTDDPGGTLVDLMEQYLADRPRALLEYDLYLAASRSPELRPLAAHWLEGLRAVLRPLADAETAVGAAALVDGAILQALVTGEPLDRSGLGTALRRLLGPLS